MKLQSHPTRPRTAQHLPVYEVRSELAVSPVLGTLDAMLTTEQFDRARRLASRLAGIELVERHRDLLQRRSWRIGIRDAAGLEALLHAAEEGQSPATQQLLSLLTTKFTGFFRHPRHFTLAAEHARACVMARGRARLWCAGTATGEEAWSLAMTLIEEFQSDEPAVSVFATDVDVEALAIATHGEYLEAAVQALTPKRREQFLGATGVPQRWHIAPAVRRLVEFCPLNLVNADWAVQGTFDVIFCRNVLMYLEAGFRAAALERLMSLLTSEGLLLLDPAEHLGKAGSLFLSRGDGAYVRRRNEI